VSTLEGIWHETRDLLDVDEARDIELSLLITLCRSQIELIGLALRDTFFHVREVQCVNGGELPRVVDDSADWM
jgi:hypothetical protein